MADGDPLRGEDGGGGSVSPKRARSFGGPAAADAGGAPAASTAITASDGDALQFLLDGLSPSPIKKVHESLLLLELQGGRGCPTAAAVEYFGFHFPRQQICLPLAVV